MADEPKRAKGAPRVFCVVSVIFGIAALALRLAYEVSRADLGTDLGISDPTTQTLLRWAALPAAGLGIAAALAAVGASSDWKTRLGAPLPGLIVNVVAIAWWLTA